MNTTLSFLTQDETKRLFAAIPTKCDRALFLTVYRYGLRASEIGMLQKTDVDPKHGRFRTSPTPYSPYRDNH
jgi:integrase